MKKVLKKIFGLIIPLAVGGVIGAVCSQAIMELPLPFPMRLVVLFAGVIVGMYLQIALHEAGHLVGGLISGYKFVSYRIGAFMLVRLNDRFALKRMSLAGTGGQCLMAPPDMVDGRMPVMLYNIAGPLANIISAAVFAILYFVIPSPAVSVMCLAVAIIGLFLGLMNGIPMRSIVDNDGRNALSLGKNPAAMRALWVQLKVNELTSMGMRLKDMPEELFAMPEEKDMNNALVASLAVFRANRLMDAHEFEAADVLMKRLMTEKSAIPAVYLTLMLCDRMLCAAVSDRAGDIAGMLTPEHKKLMRAMKTFPSVIRTEYVLALDAGDAAKAEKTLKAFESMAKKYPYPGDIASERELIDIARAALTNEQTESIM